MQEVVVNGRPTVERKEIKCNGGDRRAEGTEREWKCEGASMEEAMEGFGKNMRLIQTIEGSSVFFPSFLVLFFKFK